eukprot:3748595-Alexandrium_andersonii.AAC.1
MVSSLQAFSQDQLLDMLWVSPKCDVPRVFVCRGPAFGLSGPWIALAAAAAGLVRALAGCSQ